MQFNEAAARWWANQLKNPGLGSFNMGDDSNPERREKLEALGLQIALDKKASRKKIDSFEKLLAKEIERRVPTKFDALFLSCKYHPDELLCSIAVHCGVDPDLFPWNTSMTVHTDCITISRGDSQPTNLIF